MRGDKKNKTGHKKLGELIYRLSTRLDFQNDIQSLRSKYKIPNPITSNSKDLTNWIKKNGDITIKISFDAAKILEKYKLPYQNFTYLLGYILTENKTETTEHLIDSNIECAIIEPDSKLRYGPEQSYKDAGIKYVKILITEYASQQDVENYLSRNWSKIIDIRKRTGAKNRQLRSTQQKDRNKRICELMRASREALGLKKGEYRETKVAKIISQEFAPISEDSVKAIAKKCRVY